MLSDSARKENSCVGYAGELVLTSYVLNGRTVLGRRTMHKGKHDSQRPAGSGITYSKIPVSMLALEMLYGDNHDHTCLYRERTIVIKYMHDGPDERLGNVNTDSREKLAVSIRPPLDISEDSLSIIRRLSKYQPLKTGRLRQKNPSPTGSA